MSEGRNSEGQGNEGPTEAGAVPETFEPARDRDLTPPVAAKGGAPRVWPWLAGLLALVVAGIATSPLWAPALAPLLPWGARPAVAERDYAALAARVRAIEQRPNPSRVDLGADSALVRRVERLEAERDANGQIGATVAAAQATLQQIGQRLADLDAQRTSEAGMLQKLQQEMAQYDSAIAVLTSRVAALERQAAQRGADRIGTAQLLALLQIREAVEAALPFPAEYDAFSALVRGDRDLSAAAAPLAKAARDGVASRAQLKQRLEALAEHLETAPPAAASDWQGQALARLRSLVTIRRIGDAARAGPEAAVSAARAALARDDLSAAVAALGTLTGSNAEAARPWLQTARTRLVADAALARVQQLLVTRLGNSPTAVPVGATPTAPVKPGAPS